MDPIGRSIPVVIAEFLADGRRRNLSHRTLESYAAVLADFAQTLPPDADLIALDLASARTYLDAKADQAPASRALYVRVLRRFARWAADEYGSYPFPLQRLSQPFVPERVPRPLDPDVLLRVLGSPLDPQGYALAFLVETGLRASEATAVTLDDLTPRGVLVRHAKGGHERIVPMSQVLASATRAYLVRIRPAYVTAESGDSLLLNQRGRGHTRRTLHHLVSSAGERAGVHLAPHDLRRQFAHDLSEEASPWTVAELMGHRSLASLRTYARPAQRDLEAAIGRTSPIARAKRATR